MPMFRTSVPPDLLGVVQGAISKLNSDADSTAGRRGTKLGGAVRRLMGTSSEPSPLEEMQVDQAAAETAHKHGLVEKMRFEVERQREQERLRADPRALAGFAGMSAGMNDPEGEQAYKHVTGVRERPPVEFDNGDEGFNAPADTTANRMPDVTYAMPASATPSQERLFRAALATVRGAALASENSNAEQLAQAAGHFTSTDLMSRAADESDVPTANRLIAARSGKLREPFAVGQQGQVLNQETGAVDETSRIAQAARSRSEAQLASEAALNRERSTHADLYRAQTGKTGLETKRISNELSGADEGLPAQAFRKVTGAKLSELAPEVRLQWIQNHAAGMTPEQNLGALRQAAQRDALMNEARQVYESQYPKTLMGQRTTGAPDFLSFAQQYVAQKDAGARVPQATGGRGAKGPDVRGRIGEAAGGTQPAKPRTQAEYDALPRGAIFIDPDDGQSYRKP